MMRLAGVNLGEPDTALPLACRTHAPDRRQAQAAIPGECGLAVVPGATHLFEEPGTLEQVAALARDWFLEHLTASVEQVE